MARQVTSTYTTAPQLVVEGVKYTQYRATLRTGATVVQTQMVPLGTTQATFASVPAGTYRVRVELSSADGAQLGLGADSAEFVVPNDDTTLAVPTAVTVTVQPLG